MNISALKSLDPFGITLLVSVVVHAAVIAAVNFAPPDLKTLEDKLPSLEVVLVNAKSQSKPVKPEALAQANLNGGGNTDENRKLKSALPTSKIKPTEVSVKPAGQPAQTTKAARLKAEAERKQLRDDIKEKQAQELITQAESRKKVETEPVQLAAATSPEQDQQESSVKTINTADLLANSLEMARLEAQIAKEDDAYQKRPRRKELGARTQEYRFASYVEAWRQKVEKWGNNNYPAEAKARKLYGQLELSVDIREDGSIANIVVTRSSGQRILDDAAKHIVQLAAPYAAFPEDIRKDFQILGITRTWTFTKEDSLSGGK